jgi:hypothetical protein
VLEARALLAGGIQYGPAVGYLTLDTPTNPNSSEQEQHTSDVSAYDAFTSGYEDPYNQDAANAFIGPDPVDNSWAAAVSQFNMFYGVGTYSYATPPAQPVVFPVSGAGAYSCTGTILPDVQNPNAPVYVQVAVYWTMFSSYNLGGSNKLPDCHVAFTVQGSSGQTSTFSGSDSNSTQRDNTLTQFDTLKFKPGDTFTFTMTGSLSSSGSGGNFQGGGEFAVGFNVVTPVTPPLITPSTPAWNTSDGDVGYGYTISGAELSQATTVGLYWAPTSAFDSSQDTLIPASIVNTQTAIGSYGPFHVTPAQLGTAPQGAKFCWPSRTPVGWSNMNRNLSLSLTIRSSWIRRHPRPRRPLA